MVWEKNLSAIDRINIILQKSKLTIDDADKYLQSLLKIIENFREQNINEALSDSKNKAEALGIETELPNVRLRKKKFIIMIKNVNDNILTRLRQRFKDLRF